MAAAPLYRENKTLQMISIVVPCYNEQEALLLFYKEICKIIDTMEQKHHLCFEILFVNDGSKDNTLALMKKLSVQDTRVRYLSFSRNFGKDAAIFAGIEHVKGNYVCLMDADLQDPPALLEEMYLEIKNNGYDCVAARRETRTGEPPIRSFFARCFYKIINRISDTNIVDGARDFRLMNRKMVNAVLEIREYNRFSKGILGWVGFRCKWIGYDNVERAAGSTKWSFWKLFLYSLDGIFAFSTVPLAISSVLGIVICTVSFLYMLYIIAKTILFGDAVAGYPSLVSIILFASGIQLFCLGIMGQYLSKLYMEVKKRPIYIIQEQSEHKE